jgi:hypothetical protein
MPYAKMFGPREPATYFTFFLSRATNRHHPLRKMKQEDQVLAHIHRALDGRVLSLACSVYEV